MDTINCVVCQNKIEVRNPDLHIINHPLISQMVALHEKGVECATCGAYYLPALAQTQCAWAWTQVEKPKEVESNRIILPTNPTLN